MAGLSDRFCRTVRDDGRYGDGKGLYLVVDGSGRRWLFRYQMAGRRREMGLGPFPEIGLAAARKAADDARAKAKAGTDPIDARRTVRAVPTFGAFADQLLDDIEGGFRNEKHRAQWRMTLGDAYCRLLRPKLVDAIETADVLRVLKPIWQTKPETASRLRGRIERVLDAAKAQGYRSADNPARWRGHLQAMLPRRQKLTRGHHAALPYPDVPAFVARLRRLEAVAARALELAILTAARTSEVLGATWQEIDLANAVWTVPAERMKAGREHRVPLTTRALAILTEMETTRAEDDPAAFVFPGAKRGRPLSSMAMTMLLRRLEMKVTAHGFRSSFRDWAGEETLFAREIAEAALAHTVGDSTERAYRRGDALERRRALMAAWDSFVGAMPDTNVVPISRRPKTSAMD
jgi:integrase